MDFYPRVKLQLDASFNLSAIWDQIFPLSVLTLRVEYRFEVRTSFKKITSRSGVHCITLEIYYNKTSFPIFAFRLYNFSLLKSE